MVPSPSADDGCWRLNGQRATLHREGLEATVDLALPGRGLHGVRVASQDISAVAILGVSPPDLSPAELGPIQESYVRGRDLVATYQPSDRRPVRTQVYWRVLPSTSPAVLAVVELVVSVQTHLLDSRPRLDVVSTFDAAELLALDCAGGECESLPPGDSATTSCSARRQLNFERDGPAERTLLARPEGSDLSFVQLVHPTDWTGGLLQHEKGSSRLVHHLFPEPLEKGVIRRARVQGALVRRDDDLATAAACRRRLQIESPPLTT